MGSQERFGTRYAAPPHWAFLKVFHAVMEEGPFNSDDLKFEWWDQLPSVSAVTSLLLRQQNRRRWNPNALAHMFARLPRLQQRKTDKGARHFFAIEPSWEWPNLTSLLLTSKVLRLGEDPWLAAVFQYQTLRNARQATITWRATWEWTMEPSLIRAWEAVVYYRYDDSWSLGVVQERLDIAAIKSHGDAIPSLRLSGQVIRPISLQQIQMEQKAREGAKTV
ncbi:hypothetical protein B0H67DRAFT_602455 [Lasiosphaeris hirsuta]|uniref:DUF6546 domain-containing protein n=1 Tax=Lasiosphaeris hirsuta TaxID=260670 RepID=A0AA40A9H4_9PEZI|nr:hypothetical protein B0H67DRAFT_602455 [Lasiosphaeris hirsuta]